MDFIEGILWRNSRIAWDMCNLRFWGMLLSDQQIKSVLFELSATIILKIALKALAILFPALREGNQVEIAPCPCLSDVIVVEL